MLIRRIEIVLLMMIMGDLFNFNVACKEIENRVSEFEREVSKEGINYRYKDEAYPEFNYSRIEEIATRTISSNYRIEVESEISFLLKVSLIQGINKKEYSKKFEIVRGDTYEDFN